MFTKHMLVVSMTLVLSGCLVLREGKIPLLEPLPKETIANPKKVFVEFKLITISEDGTFILSQEKSKDFSEHFKTVLTESGSFTVVNDKNRAELKMTVETTQDNITHSNIWALLSGLSLFMVPYRGVTDFKTTLTVIEGSRKKTYQEQDQATIWVHLLLFPAQWIHMSFHDLMDNMYRHMLQEASRDFAKT